LWCEKKSMGDAKVILEAPGPPIQAKKETSRQTRRKESSHSRQQAGRKGDWVAQHGRLGAQPGGGEQGCPAKGDQLVVAAFLR